MMNNTENNYIIKYNDAILERLNISVHKYSGIQKEIIRFHQKIVFSQMIYIDDICKKNSIKICFIKGLFEAYDLYQDPSNRIVNDIDILVSRKDVKKLVELLLKNDYMPDADLTDKNILKEQLESKSIHHLCSFRKNNISVEIHLVLDTNWHKILDNKNIDITEIILSHSTDNLISGKSITTLDIEDRLIIAMHHFSRHLLCEINTLLHKEINNLFNCKTLLDAVLIYEKYKEKINYTKLYERINLYGFRDAIVLANKVISLLFEVEILNFDDLEKLTIYRYHFWENHIYAQLYTQIDEDSLFATVHDNYYKKVIYGCLKSNVSYRCLRSFSDCIIIDEYKDSLTKNRFGTICRDNLRPNNSEESSARIEMKWDEEYLHININVTDKTLKLYGSKQPNLWSDGVNISFYNPNFSISENNAVQSIMFIPATMDDGVLYILATYCGDLNDCSKYNLKTTEYRIQITDNGYDMYLMLSWKKLGFDVTMTTYIGMDFAINNVNSDEMIIDSVLSWSNPRPSYYLPTKFGLVTLE